MAIKLKFILSVIAKEAFRKLGRENGSLYSAAVAFFGLISLFPLMLLATGILGLFFGSYDIALEIVIDFLQEVIPVGTEELEQNLYVLIRQPGVLSGLGLIGFLWTGMQLFIIIQKVMNLALGAEQPTGFIRKRGIAMLMVLISGLLFAISLGAVTLFEPLRNEFGMLAEILRALVRGIIAMITFTLIYRFLPSRNIGNRGPLLGGIVAGTLFIIATYLFRWYTIQVADYTEVYGIIAGVVILLLWIYYASLIMVIGAEFASTYAQRENGDAS